ncbi:MAG: nitroreductase family protein [Candidatus Woesearchaeota archaeon]
MDVLECIRTRRSIRKFQDRPVEWEKVGRMLEAGMNAPTAGNIQDFKFIIILDPEKKQALAEACLQQYWVASAPVIILLCSDFTKTQRFYGIRGERLYSIQDCAAAAMNMLLAAHAQGLGACWVGAFDEDAVKKIAGIPDYARPQVVIPVGYPGESVPAPPKFKIENVVFIHRWGRREWNFDTEGVKDWSPIVEAKIKKVKGVLQTDVGTLFDKLDKKVKQISEKFRAKK